MDRIEILMELYKIYDGNHKFFVDTRFKALSLYVPGITLALTAAFIVYTQNPLMQKVIAIIGIVLTLYLYVIELKHWILSNMALKYCDEIYSKICPEQGLHYRFTRTHEDPLPDSKTFLDTILFKLRLTNQHRATAYITMLLIFYWILLIILSSKGLSSYAI
jgi:hypothetical protein